jgi:hypothetical protein
MTDEQIKQMAERFLGWKLPESWHPDGGIKFQPHVNPARHTITTATARPEPTCSITRKPWRWCGIW